MRGRAVKPSTVLATITFVILGIAAQIHAQVSAPIITNYVRAVAVEPGGNAVYVGLYIARRMVRFASEDVGNADPRSLTIAIAAKDAFDFLGSPEGELALAQAAVYLATAPKSNSVYSAYQMAQEDVQKSPSLPVPLHIRNAPTQLMKELGYGKGYKYAHDSEESYIAQEYLPDNLAGAKYYYPTEHGYEKKITEMMKWWESLKQSVDRSQ